MKLGQSELFSIFKSVHTLKMNKNISGKRSLKGQKYTNNSNFLKILLYSKLYVYYYVSWLSYPVRYSVYIVKNVPKNQREIVLLFPFG